MFVKYGDKCLSYFNGMFAFIIHNEDTGDTFIARDRLGIKPLTIVIEVMNGSQVK